MGGTWRLKLTISQSDRCLNLLICSHIYFIFQSWWTGLIQVRLLSLGEDFYSLRRLKLDCAFCMTCFLYSKMSYTVLIIHACGFILCKDSRCAGFYSTVVWYSKKKRSATVTSQVNIIHYLLALWVSDF